MHDRSGRDSAPGTGASAPAGHAPGGHSAHDALVHRKMVQRKAARHGEARPRHPDVAPDSVNPDHPSFDTARLGHVGHAISIRAGAIAYDGMGNPLSGPLPATPLVTDAGKHPNRTSIMAGAIAEIVIHPPAPVPSAPAGGPAAAPAAKRQRCVFVWELPGAKDGWVPVADIETPGGETHPALDAHAQHAVEVDQEKIAHRIRERQGGDGGRHQTRPLRALGSAEIAAQTTEDGKLLYICEQFNPVENRAQYFFGSTEIPLLLDCPTNDKGKPGGTWGIKDDLMPAGSRFVVDRSVAPQTIRLYLHASPKPVPGKTLTFVYGYVVNDAGERRHGWVNEAHLGPPERGGHRSKKK